MPHHLREAIWVLERAGATSSILAPPPNARYRAEGARSCAPLRGLFEEASSNRPVLQVADWRRARLKIEA